MDKESVEVKENEQKTSVAKLKGRYIESIGRRKTAQARVRLFKSGSGIMLVNGKDAADYFTAEHLTIIRQPLKLSSHLKDFDYSASVKGGGKKNQAEAIRLGICHVLLKNDPELRPSFKAKGWMTRDPRVKERKKPGLKKARRAPQWSKR